MSYRSPSTRIGWLPFAAVSCAVLGPALLAGCQSNAQYDQVAREMRMQEDELYALEDYLDQYQKLVCKYRAENAALKRQLAGSGETPTTLSPPNRSRPAPTGPAIDSPPPAEGTPPPSDIDAPDIPPLEETTDADFPKHGRKPRRRVKLASGTDADGKVTQAQAIAIEPVERTKVASAVRLHGEVVSNATGGGPRLVVQVEPLDADGAPIKFAGPLSLMLMAPAEGGVQVPVARWDYRPEDVRAAAETDGQEHAIQFHLELPADTPPSEGCQLWVRLMQRRGAKLLAHADVKLNEPGLFSSHGELGPNDIASSQSDAYPAPMVATPDEEGSTGEYLAEETSSTGPPVDADIYDGGWTIARPGQPGGMTNDGNAPKTDWRATLETPPTVTSGRVAARPKPRVSRPAAPTRSRNVASAQPPKRSEWSPERGPDRPLLAPRTATRPTWSATR